MNATRSGALVFFGAAGDLALQTDLSRARGACGSRPPRHADRPQRPPAPACHGGDRRVPRRDGSLVGLRIGRLDRLSGRRQHPAVPLAIGQIVYVRGLGAHKYRVMAVVGEPCEPRYKLRHMLAILSDTPKDILEVERPEADLTVTRPPSRHHRPGRVRGGSPRRRILDRAPRESGTERELHRRATPGDAKLPDDRRRRHRALILEPSPQSAFRAAQKSLPSRGAHGPSERAPCPSSAASPRGRCEPRYWGRRDRCTRHRRSVAAPLSPCARGRPRRRIGSFKTCSGSRRRSSLDAS
jgi:hypothetical protein